MDRMVVRQDQIFHSGVPSIVSGNHKLCRKRQALAGFCAHRTSRGVSPNSVGCIRIMRMSSFAGWDNFRPVSRELFVMGGKSKVEIASKTKE